MRVLGIDPGSRFTGFGVVEERDGRLLHLDHGVIRAPPEASLEARLCAIFQGVVDVLEAYRPDAVAVEGLFSHRNARSALVLGHARGVALLAAARVGLAVHEYPPARVKKSVGAGGADGKDSVARMVKLALSLETPARADATDALAVALCHLHQRRALVPPGPRRSAGARGRAAMALLADRLRPSLIRAVPAR